MRITKDRDTRRAELVETSTALFLEKGYEAAMVSDIVRSIGVAQGTFYYYFKTKEDVLDAALEKLLQESVERAARLVADEFQSAPQRLEGLFRMLYSPRGSVEVNPRYLRLLKEPAVRIRLEDVQCRLLQPVLAALLESGAENGDFRPMRSPNGVAEIALKGASGYMRGRRCESTAAVDSAMGTLAEFMERLLGLADNSLDFKDVVIRRRA